MHQHHDGHDHRDPDIVEQPLDAANQSLADALRASFGILKGIMTVLVVLYLFSNVRTIGNHEQALRLRLGRLLPGVHDPGLMWAFPFPIDEIVPLPTKKSNDLMIDSHTFHRREGERGKSLSFITRSLHTGLNPSLDGALLSADAGLVHAQWKVTYKIDDVSSYVSEIAGDEVEAAEKLILVLVETVGIEVASELTAEEIIRTRVDYVQREMKHRINERLAALNTGITVKLMEMYEPVPPLQVRDAFDRTQRAENSKQMRIREADQERTRILSEAAGAAHDRVVELLDRIEKGETTDRLGEQLQTHLDRVLREEVEGQAGWLIKQAGSYLSSVVGQMQSDVELYRTLVPEYERNAAVLTGRLWEETRLRIFDSPGVTKIYRPPGTQIRLYIPLDAREERIRKEKELQKQEFDVSKLRQERRVPLGPEAG